MMTKQAPPKPDFTWLKPVTIYEGIPFVDDVIARIVKAWDWWIYHRAFHSLRRMCQRDPGFSYLFFLWFKGWVEESRLNDDLRRATETFYESLKNVKEHAEQVAEPDQNSGREN